MKAESDINKEQPAKSNEERAKEAIKASKLKSSGSDRMAQIRAGLNKSS